MRWSLLPVLAALIACRSGDKVLDDGTVTDTGGLTADADGDGYDATEDCDDNNSLVNPGAAEICDGADNNCNDEIDEGVITTFYADTDGDGFGDAGAPAEACELPEGHVAVGNDCDDTSDQTFPGAPERCDGEDNDCDGDIDEDVTSTFYPDADGDGYGDAEAPVEDCDPGDGFTDVSGDCDDAEPASYPGNPEVCDEIDNNCDGTVDEDVTTTYYVDVDADGFGDPDETTEACEEPNGYTADPGDCDDADAAINPDSAEVCDGIDNDCDTLVDDADDSLDASTGSTFYADSDGDGYGDAGSSASACLQPSGYTSDATDCDDGDAAVSPAGAEVCNDIDDDCDGDVDDDDSSVDTATGSTFYADGDGDGFGDASSAVDACEQPSGAVSDATDCDDTDADISPDGEEVCDSADNDCDGTVDEDDATDAATWYADDDGDGYGDAGDTTAACDAPSGYTDDDSDCDDAVSSTNPGAAETCNSADDDCDGTVDEDDATDAATWYADDDGDGCGDVDDSSLACSQPSGFVGDDSDCDDGDSAVNPGAAETCNEVDDDCDGSVDEGAAEPDTFYADDDGDGYGDPDDTTEACDAPSGFVGDDSDCDDGDSAVNPAASEACNGEDDDCDGDADEGVLGDGASCPADDCDSILDADSSAVDGSYWIDFDGTATETECDMSTDGGGWTLIFADDFESTPASGWSLSSRYSCGSWSYLLGGYGIMAGGEIDITLDVYGISHAEAWVELEYAKLDSWDGEEAYVDVDSTNVWSDYLYYYEGSEVCGWNRGWSGSYDDLHTISEMTAHSADSLTLVAGSALNQSSTDESFGIDDVRVWVR